MKPKKKRKPQDITVRDRRAINKRLDLLELRLSALIRLLAIGVERDSLLVLNNKNRK